jgi:hypothetical protein
VHIHNNDNMITATVLSTVILSMGRFISRGFVSKARADLIRPPRFSIFGDERSFEGFDGAMLPSLVSVPQKASDVHQKEHQQRSRT